MSEKNRNVCKFAIPKLQDQLRVLHFVMERDEQTMKKKVQLKSHAAYLITDGDAEFHFDDIRMKVKAGNFIFGFAGEIFHAVPGDTCRYLYICFEGGRADELFSRYGINRANRSFGECENLIPLWKESLLSTSESNIDIASEAALLFAFSKLSRDVSKREDIIGRALDLIEEEFDDPEFSLATLAEKLGYNQKYLSHAFKEKLKIGFNEYLRNTRIKQAVFLFDHGIESVKNVAYLSGFSDPLYFSAVFKKHLGVSPKDYKSRNEKNTSSDDTV